MVASAVTAAPWLVVMSRHKHLVFAASASLLIVNYWLVVVRPRQCEPGELCHVDSPSMRLNRRLFVVSAVVFVFAIVLTYGSMLLLS